jgi:osomolarity two-component system, response regulator SSK1
MASAKIRAVRLQPSSATPLEDADAVGQDAVVFEVPSSSKFGFTWPSNSPPLSADQPLSFTSDTDTDASEADSSTINKADSGESEYFTPTNSMSLDQDLMETAHLSAPAPRLSRVFSMPTPSQLLHLRNPRRLDPSSEAEWHTKPLELSPELAHFHEVSLELADSVQVAIQTLLQLSPPHLLDHTKEQLSSCSVSVPTPSMSAIFTCMKNLNYMAANMSSFSIESPVPQPTETNSPARLLSPARSVAMETNFDIGEMLQSVGDSLSGLAAQAGVDLVLFHQDVGMKHVAVKGDESGLSYTISYVRCLFQPRVRFNFFFHRLFAK